MHMKLDRTDRKILEALQENGRVTNVELARGAGISAPPCLRRVRSLEEDGYITGYYAALNAKALGYEVTVFAHVRLSSHSEPDIHAFEQQINGWGCVREGHMLAGTSDFLLKIVARDWNDYQKFLTTRLLKASSVTHVKSSLSLRTNKFQPGIPFDEGTVAENRQDTAV